MVFRLLFLGVWGGLTLTLAVVALVTRRRALATRDSKKSRTIGVVTAIWSMIFVVVAMQGLVFGYISLRGGSRVEGPEAHFDGAAFLAFAAVLLAISIDAFKVSSQLERGE